MIADDLALVDDLTVPEAILRSASLEDLRRAFPCLVVVAVVGGMRCDVVEAGLVLRSSSTWPARGCDALHPWRSGALAAREAILEVLGVP